MLGLAPHETKELVMIVANMPSSPRREVTSVQEKVRPTHRQRAAIVYVRQSTISQVRVHHESTERQYALRDRALEMG